MKKRPEYNKKLIGENLRRCRQAKHFSVEQVREYLRLGSVQAIYKWEEGAGYPQTDTMFALMELYGIELSDLLYGERTQEPQPEHWDIYRACPKRRFLQEGNWIHSLCAYCHFAVCMVIFLIEGKESYMNPAPCPDFDSADYLEVCAMGHGGFADDTARRKRYFEHLKGSAA